MTTDKNSTVKCLFVDNAVRGKQTHTWSALCREMMLSAGVQKADSLTCDAIVANYMDAELMLYAHRSKVKCLLAEPTSRSGEIREAFLHHDSKYVRAIGLPWHYKDPNMYADTHNYQHILAGGHSAEAPDARSAPSVPVVLFPWELSRFRWIGCPCNPSPINVASPGSRRISEPMVVRFKGTQAFDHPQVRGRECPESTSMQNAYRYQVAVFLVSDFDPVEHIVNHVASGCRVVVMGPSTRAWCTLPDWERVIEDNVRYCDTKDSLQAQLKEWQRAPAFYGEGMQTSHLDLALFCARQIQTLYTGKKP